MLECDGRRRRFSADLQGDRLDVFIDGEHVELVRVRHSSSDAALQDERHYNAPMNGRIVSVSVKPGDRVSSGDTLLVMEAMKMEHRIRAHRDGAVATIDVAVGDLVNEGRTLVELATEEC